MSTSIQNPKEKFPKPPFNEPKQPFPGLENKLQLKPDFGKDSYKGSGKLKGRRALITGGDSGIGRATAVAFAREGADVAISYLEAEEVDAKETIRHIEAAGQKGLALPGDIQDEAHCIEIVNETISLFGGIDILVNNAAYQMAYEELSDITEDELDRAFRTNIYAMFFLCKAAAPHMKAGSSIINTTSIQSYDPSPILLPYAATKASITNFTKNLSHMLADKGIRVNGVAPGPIWSPLNPMAMPSVENFGKSTPLGRPGQPVELAPVYVFLASEDASYVTGAIYEITGGEFTS